MWRQRPSELYEVRADAYAKFSGVLLRSSIFIKAGCGSEGIRITTWFSCVEVEEGRCCCRGARASL